MSKRVQVHRFRIKNAKKILYIEIPCQGRGYLVYNKFGFPFALTRFGALDNSYFIAKS